MVAVPSAAPAAAPSLRRRPFAVIQGSLSSRKVARQAPVLAVLHKAADGLLIALGGSMIGLAALTVHWQSQWTRSYQELESAQVLEHRLQESVAQLERHHLTAARRPGQLIPTSIRQLVYLPSPSDDHKAAAALPLLGQVNATMLDVSQRTVRPGY